MTHGMEADCGSEGITDTCWKTTGDIKYHVVALRDSKQDPVRDDDLLRDCVILSSHDTIADAYETSLELPYETDFKCTSRNGVLRELTEVERGYVKQLDSRTDAPSMAGPM